MENKSHSKTNVTNSEFLYLLPKILVKDEDVSYEAVEELEYVLSLAKKKNIRNVAIMGPFGSGKSSVINTLIEKSSLKGKEKFLKISLATLEANDESVEKAVSNHNDENKQEDSKGGNNKEKKKEKKAEGDNGVNEEALNRKIEYSILQQIIYREKASTIPHSRLSRIVHFMPNELRKYACVIVLTILALFITLVALNFGINTLNQVINFGKCWTLVIILCFCWLLWVLCEVLTYLFKRICNLRIRGLNLREFGVELSKDESIFNRHLEEMLYLFQVTEYDVVFLEDLDRFNTQKIFLKLRELNYIINESKMIDRHITFVYAIRDDMFKDDNRTKFFDYIITIIPFINPSNSKDILKKQLSKVCAEDEIDDEALSEMGYFVQDMRLLTNIVNEYKQYKVRLCDLNHQNLDQTKLLAMMVYKNYHPHDFSLLHSRKGKVYTCISMKNDFMNERLLEQQKKYDEISEGDDNREKMKSEIERMRADMQSLRLKDLIAKYHLGDLKLYHNIELSALQDVFIRLGYIDEDFYDYISYFFENTLTQTDKDLLISMKRQMPQPFATPINKIANFVKELKGYMFESDAILNFQLLDYLAESADKQKSFFEHFVHTLIRSKQFVPFMSSYCSEVENKVKLFLRIINVERSNFWNNLTQETECKEKDELLIAYLKHCGVLKGDEKLWLSSEYPFLSSYTTEIGMKRCEEIVDDVFFITLGDKINNAKLFSYVLENNKYSLNLNNLLVIVQTLSLRGRVTSRTNLNISRIHSVNNNSFKKYVDSNISEVLDCLNDKNKDEDEDSLLYIINHESLLSEDKERYLTGQKNKIKDINKIVEQTMYDVAIKTNILFPVWLNVSSYFEYKNNQLTPELVSYLEENAEKLSKDKKGDEPSNSSDMFVKIFTNNGIDIDKYSLLIKSFPSTVYKRCSGIEKMDSAHVAVLVQYNKLPFTIEAIRIVNKSKSLADYLIHYHNEFITNIKTATPYAYNITKDVAIKLLKSSVFTEDDRKVIYKRIPILIRKQINISGIN